MHKLHVWGMLCLPPPVPPHLAPGGEILFAALKEFDRCREESWGGGQVKSPEGKVGGGVWVGDEAPALSPVSKPCCGTSSAAAALW